MSEEPQRPNPDALLAEIQREESAAKRGQLKVFFGMCPGVGKTYAMLEAARARQSEGVDVVVGVVETHGRKETYELLAGLPIITRKKIEYRGVVLQEMDIDAILERRPQLVLVDELAHTNAPGSRHPKRYQDVLELLDAGIDVYTTLNVQHLESRVDVVQQISGVPVREAVPDSVLDQADEVELIDLSPDQLRKRLSEGKVYMGERAATASENFFREETLTALREMALRATTEHVDQELRDVMRAKRIHVPWKSGQRLGVGVGPSPFSGQLIRWTRRIAAAMDAPWMAIYVETSSALSEEEKRRLTKNLSLARQLGAEVVMTTGDDIAGALLAAAREHGVTQIVVGKPVGSRLIGWLRGGSLADRIIRRGGEIDVHVVGGVHQGGEARPRRPWSGWVGFNLARDCGVGVGVVAAATGFSWLLQTVTGYGAVALVYLLCVVLFAMRLNRWAVLLMAALSALAWDWFFIPPAFTFRISSAHDVMMFTMFFVVALAMGHTTHQLRAREAAERRRERRASALNRLLESVTASASLEDGLARAVQEVDALFRSRTAVLLSTADGRLEELPHPTSTFSPDPKSRAVAAWAFEKGQAAGRFTDTLPDADALYLPLQTSKNRLGVLGMLFQERDTWTLDENDLLETFVAQIAIMIDSYRAIETAQQARMAEESERLHHTLLDSVSHELKTPLAVIGAATEGLDTQLKDAGLPLTETFLAEIKAANRRLDRIVSNLLDMTRIESGRLPLNIELGEVHDLLESAASQVENEVSRERVRITVPGNAPLVRLDFGLMEQAICNLLVNAAEHSPAGSPIDVSAQIDSGTLELRVRDHGAGLAPGEDKKVFGKFYRGPGSRPGGTGLGLSIVQGIVGAHRGEISAGNDPEGGAVFTIRIPVETGERPA
ncbi:MAG TPA: sensor histidine kinase KdpD [Verrucomicrobiae bacterium]|nr:sensor histidine kinase KdpD [Verrucomicrobiae bacterium]